MTIESASVSLFPPGGMLPQPVFIFAWCVVALNDLLVVARRSVFCAVWRSVFCVLRLRVRSCVRNCFFSSNHLVWSATCAAIDDRGRGNNTRKFNNDRGHANSTRKFDSSLHQTV